ncbi:unnamed protein product, partial [Urochloa humidicola]
PSFLPALPLLVLLFLGIVAGPPAAGKTQDLTIFSSGSGTCKHEAYAEGEEHRRAEERKQKEAQALSRWYQAISFQLLCSIVTRQRLKESYKTSHGLGHEGLPGNDNIQKNTRSIQRAERESSLSNLQTDHEFMTMSMCTSILRKTKASVRTKRCPCGFSIQVEL